MAACRVFAVALVGLSLAGVRGASGQVNLVPYGQIDGPTTLSVWSSNSAYSWYERDAGGSAYSGSFRITSPVNAAANPPAATICVPAAAGSYLASAFIRGDSGALAKGNVRLRFYSDAGCTVPLAGPFNSVAVPSQLILAWDRVTLLKTAPTGTHSARLSLVMSRAAGSNVKQSVAFDNISLTATACRPDSKTLCLLGRFKVTAVALGGINVDQFVAVQLSATPDALETGAFSMGNGSEHVLLFTAENDCATSFAYRRMLIGGIVQFPVVVTVVDMVASETRTFSFDPQVDGPFFPAREEHWGCVP